MITVRRIMGVETEYALIDRDDPSADPDRLARALLFTYAREAAAGGAPSTDHVPADAGPDFLQLIYALTVRCGKSFLVTQDKDRIHFCFPPLEIRLQVSSFYSYDCWQKQC